jgi:hypothetical protein
MNVIKQEVLIDQRLWFKLNDSHSLRTLRLDFFNQAIGILGVRLAFHCVLAVVHVELLNYEPFI